MKKPTFVLMLIFIIPISSWSVWTCKGMEQWPTDNENINASIIFQRWLYSWQNNCQTNINSKPILHGKGGYGHSFVQITQQIVSSIEMGIIYLSTEKFIWADDDSNACTMNMQTISCYLQPMTTCSDNDSLAMKFRDPMVNITESLNAISNSPLDSCSMARLAKKSLMWVNGQFLMFLMRPREDILIDIKATTNPILNYRKDNESIIAVHIRGGTPDGGRVPLNVSLYLEQVDIIALEIERSGKQVVGVFLCSDQQEENIKSTEYMTEVYPRKWKYFVIPHVNMGPGEAEHNLNNPNVKNKPSKRSLMIDFLVDIDILSSADAFIGSSSNIFFMVSAIRAAKQSGQRNHTCVLQGIRDQDPSFLCENSIELKKIWTLVSKGFDGGTSFAEY